MLALCLFLHQVKSNLVEYRFSNSFGQKFWDYSGNNNHGSNNLAHSKIKSTDRGVYLLDDDSRIEAPSNLALPSMLTYLGWVMPEDSQYRLIFRVRDTGTRYHIGRKMISSAVYISVFFNGNSAEAIGPNDSFPSGQWSLLALTYNGMTFKAFINANEKASLFHSFTTSSAGFYTGVGTYYSSSFTAVKGFVWNFIIMTGTPNYLKFMSSSSSNCLIPGICSSCSVSIVDYDFGTGCLPTNMDPSKNSEGISCASSSTGCSVSTEYFCGSSSVACLYDRLSNACYEKMIVSPYNITTVQCKCQNGYVSTNNQCCNSDCDTCDMTGFCLKCKALNSFLSSGICYCLSGYFLSTPPTTCLECNPGCKTCSSSDKCLTCFDINMIRVSDLCTCNYGFYHKSDDECGSCNIGCKTCSSTNLCISCWDNINMIVSNRVCICKIGIYNANSKSCDPCNSGCKSCSSIEVCLECWNINMVISGANCVCKDSYYIVNSNDCKKCLTNCFKCTSEINCIHCKDGTYPPLCSDCHSKCETCIGPEFNECVTCKHFILQDICSDTCPVGFIPLNKKCENRNLEVPTLSYKFDGIGEVFYDLNNNISAHIQKSDKRNTSEPQLRVAYARGLYFPTLSCLEITENSKIFNNHFSLSIWLRPKIDSAVIISKYNGDKTLQYFTLSYNQSSFNTDIFIRNSINFNRFSNSLKTGIWNHVFVSINQSSETLLTVSINKIIELRFLSSFPFTDSDSSFMIIGSDLNMQNSFKGFIYSIELYAIFKNEDLFASLCQSCDICLISGICLSLCEIEEFFDEKTKSCKNCPNECICRNPKTCLQCSDQFCEFCENFEQKSCYKCPTGFELKNKICEKCKDQEFYDEKKTCQKCPSLCRSCVSSSKCLSCEENSILNDSKCFCEKGFSFEGTCKRNYFTAELDISEDNSISLSFSEPLDNPLEKEQILVKIDEKRTKFKVQQKNSEKYILIINEDDIFQDSFLVILFQKEMISVKNSLLKQTSLSGKLYLTEKLKTKRELEKKAAAAQKVGNIGVVTGVSVGLLVSLSTQDPSSLFDFLNTAEIFYSVYLFEYELNLVLSSFLLGLRLQDSLPNLFYFILDTNEGVETSSTLKKFGFTSNLFIINIGVLLETLLSFLVISIILALLNLISFFRIKLISIIKNFKFAIFLRFWIQSFYEMSTALLYSFKYSKLENKTQYIDFSFSVLFAALEISGLFLMINLLRLRKHLKDDDEQNKLFLSKFGTFFEEFKERGVKDWMFYLIFIFRRVVLVVCYYLGKYAEVQLALSLFFSLLTCVYFLIVWPNKQLIFNFYHILNELLISAYNLILIISYADGSLTDSLHRANLCIYLVYAAWGLNVFCSLIIICQKIRGKIKEWMEKRKANKVENKYINKTAPDIFTFYRKPHVID